MKTNSLSIITTAVFLVSIEAAADISANSPIFQILSKPQVDCFVKELKLGPETLSSLPQKTSQERCELFSSAVGCLLESKDVIAKLINKIGEQGKENPGIDRVLKKIHFFKVEELKKSCSAISPTSSPSIEPKAAGMTADRDFCC